MPLKPGQTKELKVKIVKLKELTALEKKLQKLNWSFSDIKNDRDLFVRSEYTKLIQKIKNDIETTKKEIEKLSKSKANKNPAADKLIKTIAKDCSEVIPFYRLTGRVLLRGVKAKSDAYMGRSWESRRPTHSVPWLQELYDNVLKKKGFEALRSNSIYTTSDSMLAEKFGEVYMIFPKNGFKFHWNQFIQDLVLNDPGNLLDIGYIEDVITDADEWSYKKSDEGGFDVSPYTAASNLNSFIKELQDIGYPKAAKFTPETFINYEYIKRDIGPTKTNFKKGLVSGNEMLIAGEYYAIKLESGLGDYVLNALNIKYKAYDEY